MIVLRAVIAYTTQCKSFLQAYCEPEIYALIHISIQEAAMFVHREIGRASCRERV